jgi:acetyl esterase/lipase
VKHVAIVAGPDPELRDGWQGTLRRWAHAAGVGSDVFEARDRASLRGAIEQVARTAGALLLAPGGIVADDPDDPDDSDDGLRAALAEVAGPIVHVATGTVADPSPVTEDRSSGPLRRIHGRGFAGFHWALRHLAAELRSPASPHHYGSGPGQVADLRVPRGPGPHPIAVLLHGGFWRDEWERDTFDPHAVALTESGWATWNVSYRRCGPSGGGWPATWEDVASAVDALADVEGLDPERVVLVGHSVGGALACWVARRREGRITARAVVAVAGLLDLRYAAQTGLGDGATRDAIGDPAAHPERYSAVSPVEIVPIGVPTHLLHGGDDEVVPPVVSRTYETTAAAAGDDVEATIVPDARHFDPLLPEHPSGSELLDLLERLRDRL